MGCSLFNNSTITQNQAFMVIPTAVYNSGNAKLTIMNSTVSGNSAGCGNISCAGFGGGILNVGSLFINNSSLVGNIAWAHFAVSQGGAIDNHFNQSGIVKVSNSTISGNGAFRGGGISGLVGGLQNSIV